MPPVGFEPTTPTGERPQTHALDGAIIDPRLRPRGQWDRLGFMLILVFYPRIIMQSANIALFLGRIKATLFS
jgi:hypothetical protein